MPQAPLTQANGHKKIPKATVDELTAGSFVQASATTDTADATAELQALLNRGGVVSLEPGRTYIVDKPLLMTAGQTLYGNHATIKRAAQVAATTTTTTITAFATTSVTVARVSGFKVGMGITFEQGGTYNEFLATITAINGNTITFDTAPNQSFSGTTNVYHAQHLLKTADDCVVLDLELDGNGANWTFARFEHTVDLAVCGSRNRIVGCYIHDSPGEGLTCFSGDHQTIRDCWVQNCKGNGIHFSQQEHVVVDGCRVIDVNNDTSVGHADGCIIWSNGISHATVVNNYCEAGIAGIGSIDSTGNSDVSIIGNTLIDCTTFGIEINTSSADDLVENIVVVGNRIYNCVANEIVASSESPSVFPRNCVFSNNHIEDTVTKVYRYNGLTFTGNRIYAPANTTGLMVEIHDCKDVDCGQNVIEGGNYGIWMDGASRSENILIGNNICRNQRTSGIRTNHVDVNGIRVANNVISNAAASAQSGYFGIYAAGRHLVTGNYITLASTPSHSGIYGQSDAIIEGNYIRSLGAGPDYAVRLDGGTSGAHVKRNYAYGTFDTAEFSDGSGGSNTFADNI